MQTRILFILLSLSASTFAHGAEPTYKPATEAQIIRHLKSAGELEKRRDGFSYKLGHTTGYKFSHGKICVKKKGTSVDCVSVRTDGENFLMVDRRGNKELF